MSLTIKCFPYGPLGENTYLVTDNATGDMAVIDPGFYGEPVIESMTGKGSLKYILLTHGHYDHFAAAADYIEQFPDAEFAVPEGESYLLRGSRDNKMFAYGSSRSDCPNADITLSEGDTIVLGETVFKVIETPGHTEGGICFATDNELFSGDTLFRLSVGNTSFETGDWSIMVRSIQNKLYTLKDELVVYPGHGPATTIGYEKRANPFV